MERISQGAAHPGSAERGWRVEILDEDADERLTLTRDVGRYGLPLLMFVLGWLLASLTPVRLPLP